jgi:hypothetical protein
VEALSVEHKLGVACSVSQADELVIWRLRLQVWRLRLLAVEQLAARAFFEGPACLEEKKNKKSGVHLQVMALLLPSGDRFIDFLLLYNCCTTAVLLLY